MFAVIYIPEFSLQAVLRTEPELHDSAVALVDGGQSKGAICQMTPSARRLGVVEGMTPTQAMARCPKILIKNRSFAREKTAGDVLLHCAYSFAPWIEATAPGVCTLELKGQRRPIDETIGQEIIDLLAQFQMRSQVGIAENPGLAFLAARSAQPVSVIRDRIQFLAGVPLENLEPPHAILSVLKKWGLQTVGEFIALGRDRIAERLGSEGLDLFDRASASTSRPLKRSHPPETYEESMDFEREIEAIEPLLFVLRRFLDQICRRLELVYSVIEKINLQLSLASGDTYEQSFQIPAPTRNLDTLFRVLHTHLENLTTAHPITALRLEAKPCKPRHHQFGLFETSLRDPNHFSETLARLTALLGSDRVGTPVAEVSHRPDAFRMDTVRFGSSAVNLENAEQLPPVGLTLRRLRPPLPVRVGLQNDRPAALDAANPEAESKTINTAFLKRIGITSRGQIRIHKSQGPWRTSGNWWDDRQWERDEWDVQTRNGGLLRLSHVSDGWFVEGVYD